jgi:L-iditol 2-dehydrogenase
MRAAVVTNSGKLEVQDLPTPSLRPGDLLIRSVSCGLCGSDLYKIQNRTVPPGTVLGHEIVGVVESCPPRHQSRFPLGARVTVSNHIPCGTCAACARGRISMCPQFQSTHVDPGGFAEFIRVPSSHLPDGVIPLPEGLPDDRALMAEPLGCCLRAMERWNPEKEQSVLVMGLGTVGQLMVLLLRGRGARPLAVDPLEIRRSLGLKMGCEAVFHPEDLEGLRPVQGVVLTVCNDAVLELGLRAVEPGGWIGLFAGPREDIPIPVRLQRLYRNEIDLIPSYSTGPQHMRQALGLLVEGAMNVDGLITHDLPIEEIQRAVDMAGAQQGLKSILRF